MLYHTIWKAQVCDSGPSWLLLFIHIYSLTTFKVLNSIILLGHSYKVIEDYDKEQTESTSHGTDYTETANQDSDSCPSNQNDGSRDTTNENFQSSSSLNVTEIHTEELNSDKTDLEEPLEKYVKHERSASCDGKVGANFSEILLADSYTELTMISNIDVIECSKDPSLNKSNLRESVSDTELNDAVNGDKPVETININENSTEDAIPIQETVFITKSDKENVSFPKSERFFVNISHRNTTSRSSPESLSGTEIQDIVSYRSNEVDKEMSMDNNHLKTD